MGRARSTPSVAIARSKIWRIQSRRSRKKQRPSDPTVAQAERGDLPTEDKVREYLGEFVRLNRRLGVGLFTAKLLDAKRPPKSLAHRVRQEFGIEATDADLLRAASDAEFEVRSEMRKHFGVTPKWHWRWLPRIEAV